MRISVDINDPGYHKDAPNLWVFVDGELFEEQVITIDVDQQYAIVFDTDADGNLQQYFDLEANCVAVKTKRIDLTGRRIELYREHEPCSFECEIHNRRVVPWAAKGVLHKWSF